MISCRILGPVEVSVDGGPAPPELLWRKNLALLLYLARSPGLSRSRDHLIGLLWGDKPESAARHSLNESLRVLRKHLGADGLETDAALVRLTPGAVELDVELLDGRVRDRDWREAARLIAGEFMEGFSVPGCSQLEDWLYSERVAWRERSVEALVSRATELVDAGELKEATSLARRALSHEPTSTPAAEAAMRGLAIAGDRAAALELYRAFVERLDQEVGIEPDESTQELAERIRLERTWKIPERLAAPAPWVESRRAPLVGREVELGKLIEAWKRCRETERATLGVIEGDPGMGKSRLAEELAARARLDGAVVTTARAVEADAAEAWSGVLAVARGLPVDGEALGSAPAAALGALASRLPDWAERFTATGEAAPSVGRALVDVLAAIARRRPVLVLVDDAGWLDRDSLLTLGALLRDLRGAPIFVLIALAPQPERPELEELRAHVGRELDGVAIKMRPLPVEALRTLAAWAFPSYEAVELDRLTRRVSTDSAGLPLLALELLHAVALGLDLGSAGKAWPEPYRTLDQSLPGELPDAVVAAVRIGFRRLSADAQKVLASAAALDERFDAIALRRVTSLEPETLARALDELEWQRWLSADSRGYSFVARMVREVVGRDMLTPGQRQRIIDSAQTSSI